LKFHKIGIIKPHLSSQFACFADILIEKRIFVPILEVKKRRQRRIAGTFRHPVSLLPSAFIYNIAAKPPGRTGNTLTKSHITTFVKNDSALL